MRDEPAKPGIGPETDEISRWTDRYFLKTKETIGRFGDKTVTYAVFMRRPVILKNRLCSWAAPQRS